MKHQNNKRLQRQEEARSAYLYPFLSMKVKQFKMPYGPYSQRPYHHQPYHHSTFAPQPNVQHSAESTPDSWACDYCKVATFATFEEAYAHEQVCPMNQNILSTNHDYHEPRSDKDTQQQSMTLAMPADKNSLSDRQCYVRSDFVEIFCADANDVAARHSKGAQKLHVGQIGIRCKHCTNFHTKKRAERAVCYPSSISRIYQTVADMQRFHFEVCTAIPMEMKTLYKNLKTTRPRGMGSPQEYWIASAKEIGLIDTDQGIRSSQTLSASSEEYRYQTKNIGGGATPMSTPPASPMAMSITHSSSLPPLSPESQSTAQSPVPHEHNSESSDSEMPDRDMEANMLLALRNPQTRISKGAEGKT